MDNLINKITVPQAQEHVDGLRQASVYVEKAKRILESNCHQQVVDIHISRLEALSGDMQTDMDFAQKAIDNAEVQL